MCITDSLCCVAETNTTFKINYILQQKQKKEDCLNCEMDYHSFPTLSKPGLIFKKNLNQEEVELQ